MTARRDDSRLPASARKDGRGHWPAGVPRSDLRPGVMTALRAARTSMTLRQMAAALACDSTAVSKWLRGKLRPSDEFQTAILTKWGRQRQ